MEKKHLIFGVVAFPPPHDAKILLLVDDNALLSNEDGWIYKLPRLVIALPTYLRMKQK